MGSNPTLSATGIAGHALTLAFQHGLGGTWRYGSAVAEAPPTFGHRAVLVDLPGFGDSPEPWFTCTVERHLDALHACLQDLVKHHMHSATSSLREVLYRNDLAHAAAALAPTLPVSFIHRFLDTTAPNNGARTLAATHPGWRPFTLPDVDHQPRLRELRQRTELIANWLRPLATAAPVPPTAKPLSINAHQAAVDAGGYILPLTVIMRPRYERCTRHDGLETWIDKRRMDCVSGPVRDLGGRGRGAVRVASRAWIFSRRLARQCSADASAAWRRRSRGA